MRRCPLVADKIVVANGGETLRVDLADKAIRRFPEHAALVIQAFVGTVILNR